MRKNSELKRQAIMREAVHQMNTRGANAVSLGDIAKSLGKKRNSIYYYFKDKAELVYCCFLEATLSIRQNLICAQESSDNAVEQIHDFVSRSLLSKGSEYAVMSDLHVLPDAYRQEVQSNYQENILKFEQLLREGIESGRLRLHETRIAAHVMLGLIDWGRVWHIYVWNSAASSEASDQSTIAVEAILDLFLNGVAHHSAQEFKCTVSAKALTTPDFDAFCSKSLAEEKRRQLIGVASRMFNQRGIDAVSIDDIVEQLGATKGVFYHYFDDKRSLVEACFHRAFHIYEKFVAVAENQGRSGLEKYLTVVHLNCQAQVIRFPPLVLQAGMSNLASELQENWLRIATRLQRTRLEGITDGSHRNNHRRSIELSVGLFYWIPAWITDNPRMDESKLADSVCNLLHSGIAVNE